MIWRIEHSRGSDKFIEEHNIQPAVREELKKFLLKIKGVSINID